MNEDIKNDNLITDEALAAAKEKLACHIEPPGTHQTAPAASCGGSCSIQPAGEPVRLTQMTSAGG